MAKTLLYLYTESPLHAGMGSGLGTIDLPIQRERHTDYPVVQGSGIKGALRALACQRYGNTDQRVLTVFGPQTENASEYAGALTVGDARLLLFPVRSLRGVFAWTTAPLVLRRLHRDIELLTGTPPPWTAPALPDERQNAPACVLVPTASAITLDNSAVVLEEYTFTAQAQAPTESTDLNQAEHVSMADQFADWLGGQLTGLDNWWVERIRSHLVILPDTVFRDFVLYSTEIVTRVRLNIGTKTVERGGLWTEESLPTDSLLYSLVMTRQPARSVLEVTSDDEALAFVRGATNAVFQLGGDETVGRGIVRPIWDQYGGAR